MQITLKNPAIKPQPKLGQIWKERNNKSKEAFYILASATNDEYIMICLTDGIAWSKPSIISERCVEDFDYVAESLYILLP